MKQPVSDAQWDLLQYMYDVKRPLLKDDQKTKKKFKISYIAVAGCDAEIIHQDFINNREA